MLEFLFSVSDTLLPINQAFIWIWLLSSRANPDKNDYGFNLQFGVAGGASGKGFFAKPDLARFNSYDNHPERYYSKNSIKQAMSIARS